MILLILLFFANLAFGQAPVIDSSETRGISVTESPPEIPGATVPQSAITQPEVIPGASKITMDMITNIGNGKCFVKNRTTPPVPEAQKESEQPPTLDDSKEKKNNDDKKKPKPWVAPNPKKKNNNDDKLVMVAGDKDNCISLQNLARVQVGVAPMVWNAKLAVSAQKWANHLYTYNLGMTHSTGQGENLYRGTGECKGATQAWVDNERPLYAPGAPIGEWGDFHAYGHFTQIIYRSTTRAGCSIPHANGGYFVCHYMPQQVAGTPAY